MVELKMIWRQVIGYASILKMDISRHFSSFPSFLRNLAILRNHGILRSYKKFLMVTSGSKRSFFSKLFGIGMATL